jgi:uncharacterized protein involved in exopolysaccharide biosynthesis
MARIEEAKDVNTIQILDSAVPPESKFGPKRGRLVITSSLIAIIVSLAVVLGKEYLWKIT